MGYSDSHTHLVDYNSEQLKMVLGEMDEKQVDYAVAVGVNISTSAGTIRLAKVYDKVLAAIGIHPWFAVAPTEELKKNFIDLLESKQVSMLGEIGLDYIPQTPPKDPPKGMPRMEITDNSPAIQKELFLFELSMAKKYQIPVNIHCDSTAHQDMINILRTEVKQGLKGIIHGFEGSLEMLRDWLGLDFYIALGVRGVIKDEMPSLAAIVREIPLDRLITETDSSPMTLPGEKLRGPADVVNVVQKIALIRGITENEVANSATDNLKRLLKLM